MRRRRDAYMFTSLLEAEAYRARVLAGGAADPYQPTCTVAEAPDLPAPYTHRATVERWNSCD